MSKTQSKSERHIPRPLQRLVSRRELKAFEAGWIAGARRMEDALCGYSRPQNKNLIDAWQEYRRTTAPANDQAQTRQPSPTSQSTSRPLDPVWNWESTGTNGGRIIGSCKTPKELGEMVVKLAEHSETESIRIGKCRRDYDPMLPGEKMWEIISANGDERKAIMRELANEKGQP